MSSEYRGHSYTTDYNRKYQRGYYKKFPERYVYWGIKRRCKLKNIPFNITYDDCLAPEYCPVLGIPLSRNVGKNKPSGNSPSVDRIDPLKGYVKGNAQVISQRANIMKNDASVEELQRFAQWVLKVYPL